MTEDDKKMREKRLNGMMVVFDIMYGKKKPEGIPVKTGFEFFDSVSGGFKPGELVILASTGKPKSVVK